MANASDAHRLIEGLYARVKDMPEVRSLKEALQLDDGAILAAWIFWDTGLRDYGNEAYSSIAIRMAMHLHNLLPGSWHAKRQEIVSAYMKHLKPASACEIGFGTPQRYVRELLRDLNAEILLADFDEPSMEFARALLPQWDPGWNERIALRRFDMNTDSLPKQFDAYVFQDSLEHADDPTNRLRAFVDGTSSAHFVFSLPVEIENPIPEHHIHWKNDGDVLRWLREGGLSIVDYEAVPMDRDVDVFARSLHPEFHELVILARTPS